MPTLEQLQAIMPYAHAKAGLYVDALNAAMDEFGIDTAARQAAFLAQIGHESGQFRYVEEIASGAAYEGRKDLGNTESGDGMRFKGRGLIQITGRTNYAACGSALGLDLLSDPTLLERPEPACRSAAWFWWRHNLNDLADAGDLVAITRRINGGTNGLANRSALYRRALEVLA